MVQSLISVEKLDPSQLQEIFSLADSFSDRTENKKTEKHQAVSRKILHFLFLEPSTRTRISFEMAAHLVGAAVVHFDANASSMQKGESLTDTLLNLAAMGASGFVVRTKDENILSEIQKQIFVPMISAGEGRLHHPTQALLDAYTIQKEFGVISGQKILLVGDIKHSRVARSNMQLLKTLGAQLAVCAPQDFLPEDLPKNILQFSKLEEALNWCNVCIALRVQLERHQNLDFKLQHYVEKYSLDVRAQKWLGKNAILMHPGPVNYGVELQLQWKIDPRNRILKQVANGVFVRAAILQKYIC